MTHPLENFALIEKNLNNPNDANLEDALLNAKVLALFGYYTYTTENTELLLKDLMEGKLDTRVAFELLEHGFRVFVNLSWMFRTIAAIYNSKYSVGVSTFWNGIIVMALRLDKRLISPSPAIYRSSEIQELFNEYPNEKNPERICLFATQGHAPGILTLIVQKKYPEETLIASRFNLKIFTGQISTKRAFEDEWDVLAKKQAV